MEKYMNERKGNHYNALYKKEALIGRLMLTGRLRLTV